VTYPVVAIADGAGTDHGAYNNDVTGAWTGVSLPTFSNGSGTSWRDVCYSPELNLVIAVANGIYNNNNLIAKSADQGATWTGVVQSGIDGGASGWSLQSVCWSPALGLFVAAASAGSSTSNRILYSSDGDTWTAAALPQTGITLASVCWSEDLEMFCAVGNSNAIYTSTNGTSWTQQTGPATSKNWIGVCWAGGTIQKFVAVCSNSAGGNDEMYSSDGASWTQQTLTGSSYQWAYIAYSPDLDQIMVVGGNTGVVAYSANATSWTQIATGIGSVPFQAVCWSASQSKWCAVGTNASAYSANGSSWTVGTSPGTASWNGVCALTVPGPGGGGGDPGEGGGSPAINRGFPVRSYRHFPIADKRDFPTV
jgi:hypothetical protein